MYVIITFTTFSKEDNQTRGWLHVATQPKLQYNHTLLHVHARPSHTLLHVYNTYRCCSFLVKLLFLLQFFIELTTRGVLQDQVDTSRVVEIAKQAKNVWVSKGIWNAELKNVSVTCIYVCMSEWTGEWNRECKTVIIYFIHIVILWQLMYLRCDWISISRLSWCSTDAFCNCDLNKTCTVCIVVRTWVTVRMKRTHAHVYTYRCTTILKCNSRLNKQSQFYYQGFSRRMGQEGHIGTS